MKFSTVVSCYAAASLVPGTLAWPGMSNTLTELQHKLKARADAAGAADGADAADAADGAETGEDGDSDDIFDSDELIGDLVYPGPTTPIGHSVANIITGLEDGFSDVAYTTKIPPKASKACAADTCCIWTYIASDLKRKFTGKSGRCNGFARAAVRQGFHDAGAWNKNSTNGGADGSLILAGEIARPENNGLQPIIGYTWTLYKQYKPYGVGMADLIQFMANTATVICPLGPRVRTYVGRPDSSLPAPDGLLPSVSADADSLIALFEDKTIKSNGLAALVGAHSTSQQQFVDTSRAFDPQDSTPGVWDNLFYRQTTADASAIPKRVFRFPSDMNLAAHPQVAPEWNDFATDQQEWNEYYSREYVRLSLLGVNVINNLVECTKALPAAKKTWTQPDKPGITKWLSGAKNTNKLGPIINAGDTLTTAVLQSVGVSAKRVRGLWN